MPSPLIELEDVSIIRNEKAILDKLTLRIEQGEHVAILGPNGCGKSTLIKTLTREIYPHAGLGAVRVLGNERWVIRELRTVLGVVSDEPREPLLGEPDALTVVVSGLLGTYGVVWGYDVTPAMWDKARAALEFVDAAHLEERDIRTLSAGEHRRVFIARALISDPQALVLDEPTTSLDIRAQHEFVNTMRKIAASGKSLILVTHHFEEIIPEIERVILLKRGKVFQDGPRDQVLTSANITELFGVPIQLEIGDVVRARCQ